jgi:hypothetical protein
MHTLSSRDTKSTLLRNIRTTMAQDYQWTFQRLVTPDTMPLRIVCHHHFYILSNKYHFNRRPSKKQPNHNLTEVPDPQRTSVALRHSEPNISVSLQVSWLKQQLLLWQFHYTGQTLHEDKPSLKEIKVLHALVCRFPFPWLSTCWLRLRRGNTLWLA